MNENLCAHTHTNTVLCVTFHPNTTSLWTVLEVERRRAVFTTSLPPHLQHLPQVHTLLSFASLMHSSLFLSWLFRALCVRPPTPIRPLWPLTPLPLLFSLLFRSLYPVSSVRAFASSLWPVVGLAAIGPCTLVSGWGSRLRQTPFADIVVLRNTGGNVVYPQFEVVLQWGQTKSSHFICTKSIWWMILTYRRKTYLIFSMKQKLAAIFCPAEKTEE